MIQDVVILVGEDALVIVQEDVKQDVLMAVNRHAAVVVVALVWVLVPKIAVEIVRAHVKKHANIVVVTLVRIDVIIHVCLVVEEVAQGAVVLCVVLIVQQHVVIIVIEEVITGNINFSIFKIRPLGYLSAI